ncbi:MAG: ATP-dependent DNA helicase RecG [Parcubacteria group bacterium]|nr:ATP-dependent DNA helicase RecG [Parcubacteria group bacterium]
MYDSIFLMSLESKVEEVLRITPVQKNALKKLGIKTIEDLLYHFPARYGEQSQTKNISTLKEGDRAEVFGEIKKLKTSKAYRKKIPMAEGVLEDHSGKIKIVWFNQPYIAKMYQEGSLVKIEGRVSSRKEKLYISNPDIKNINEIPKGAGNPLFEESKDKDAVSLPVYPESRGITSMWFYHVIQKLFGQRILDEVEDPIPEKILKKYNLPTLKTAFVWIHTPQKKADALSARKRFAFQEIFMIQIQKQKDKKSYQEKPSFKIEKTGKEIDSFAKKFPFESTNSQKKAIKTILGDFEKNYAMSRLLEGDVGSGKTYVAAVTSYAVITTPPDNKDFGALQTAYMAPTEILANQLFENFIEYFKDIKIQIGLITSSGCKKFPSKVSNENWTNIPRGQLLKWVENGEIPILIGTHALIQKTVKFKNLAYVIIDEQHRFGTGQRRILVRKDGVLPHLLSMTATPIPRTLALTIYGDLDLTLLDEMPKGRKPVITEVVKPDKRERAYEEVRAQLRKGHQVYVICPRIDEPDPKKEQALRVKSVKEEAKRLKSKIFPEYNIEMMHGKMKPKEKEETMKKLKDGKIDILVSTSVVEVGVNIPNATSIIIEGAERFGLAQLHQLRGRVIRSTFQPYAFIFSDTKAQRTMDRLNALKKAKNGFKLAEYDLEFRGAGDLAGKKQWGITDLGMEAIRNIKMVEAAREEAMGIIESDFELKKYPLIKAQIEKRVEIHFE